MSAPPSRAHRDTAVDLVRGYAMILMALDHTREFFGAGGLDPTDLSQTTPALFFTRWITHPGAPIFVFLAGAAVYLSQARGKPPGELTGFLIKRGLWLILLELTVVRFGWFFNLNYESVEIQVFWALGASMILLAGLIHLPLWVSALLGLGLVAGHNALDGIKAQELGSAGWLWSLLHEPNSYSPWPGIKVDILYPLLPWAGLMALGYAAGPWLNRSPEQRRSRFLAMGLGSLALFVALRAAHLYGDPRPFVPQASTLYTVMSFLNCEKYPPSLLFMAMAMAPVLVALALLRQPSGWLARLLTTYGKVPLFYYLLHLCLIHLGAALVLSAREGTLALSHNFFDRSLGFSLGAVYLISLLFLALLYPACLWFAALKARRNDPWLSYL